MGKSVAIKFTVYLVTRDDAGREHRHTPSEWRVRARLGGRIQAHGKPSLESLSRYVAAFEASTQSGGCNGHLGQQKVVSAQILDQDDRSVVARFTAQS